MKREDVHIPSKGIDRISSLPEDLKSYILMHLPIRDAVRTSILSSTWRYVWSILPILCFDERSRLSLKEKPTSSRLMRIVDHVLPLHKDPVIQGFVVSNYLMGYDIDMDKWIVALSRKNVRYLGLSFFKSVEDANQVSSSLFSCKQLRFLHLHHCTLEMPPTFQGFKYLKYLDLKTVTLHEATINNLLPLCPVLEELFLEYGNHLGCLNINAPKLELLFVHGAFDDIVFTNCSELENINIFMFNATCNFYEDEIVHTCKLDKDLGCLPSLVNLQIHGYFLQYMAMGTFVDRVPNAFANLKNLHLTVNFRDTQEISTTLSIIRSSPKLQSVEIFEEARLAHHLEYDPDIWENVSDRVLHRLKRFTFYYLNGDALQMAFLKFVLANSPVLHTMSITIANRAMEEKSSILESLISYRRASCLLKEVEVDKELFSLALLNLESNDS